MCGFLQGDSYSPVGFCISEIPVCKLLQQSKGYRMGAPGNRSINRTHSLFIDDLKQYQESHEIIKDVKEIIVQASLDTLLVMVLQSVRRLCLNVERWLKGKDYQC